MTIYGFFKDNKLVYTGQTISKVEYRIQKHFNSAKTKKCQNMPIIRAISKYGKDCFNWKILATCKTQDELNQQEVKLIAQHSPRHSVQSGGKNGKLADSTKKQISERQKKKILCVDDQICFFSVIDAEQFYNAGKGTIGRVAQGKKNSYQGKKFEFINCKTSMDERAEVN